MKSRSSDGATFFIKQSLNLVFFIPLFFKSFIFVMHVMKRFVLYIVFLLLFSLSAISGFFHSEDNSEEYSTDIALLENVSNDVYSFSTPARPSLPDAEFVTAGVCTHVASNVRLTRFISENFVLYVKQLMHRLSYLATYLSLEKVKHSHSTTSFLYTNFPSDFYIFFLRRILI